MSLVCHNCGHDMGPTDDLPGRDGTMVHPIVLSLVWMEDEPTGQEWTFSYVMSPTNRGLCFRCIIDKLGKDRQHILEAVFAAYRIETQYRRAEEQEQGRLLTFEEIKSLGLFRDWEAKAVLIPPRCIFCDVDIPDNENPFFAAKTLDRAYCEKHLSWFGRNYSYSKMETGLTRFRICLKCLRENFPRIAKQLSYDLRGVVGKSTVPSTSGAELYITLSAVEALKRQVGEERALEMIKELPGSVNLRIMIDPADKTTSSS